MDQRYGKKEKLKSKILINRLFSEGKSLTKFPLKMVYLPMENPEIHCNQAAVSVPKRNFKKAVDRIHLKRLMREAYRKNKYLVAEKEEPHALMFLYLGKKQEDYHKIFAAVQVLLKSLAEKELK